MNFINVSPTVQVGNKPTSNANFIGVVYSNVLQSSLDKYLPLSGSIISGNIGIGSNINSLNTLNVNNFVTVSSNINVNSNVITSNINSITQNNSGLLTTSSLTSGSITFTKTLSQNNTELVFLSGLVSLASNISFNASTDVENPPISSTSLMGGSGSRIIFKNAKTSISYPDAIGLDIETMWMSSSNIAIYTNGINRFNINLNGILTTSNQINQINSSVNNFFMGNVGIATTNTNGYNLNINGSLNANSISINNDDLLNIIIKNTSNYTSNVSNVILTNTSNYTSNVSNVILTNTSNYTSDVSNVILTNTSNYTSDVSNVILTNTSNYASNISNVIITNTSNYASNISNVIITNTSNYASNISNVIITNTSNYTSNVSNVILTNTSNYTSNVSNVILTNTSNYTSNVSNVILTNTSNYASNISNVIMNTLKYSPIISLNLDNQPLNRYPPAAITSSSGIILSSSYYNNGTYIATASSSSETAFNCFNYDDTVSGSEWTSPALYSSTSPYDYISTTSTVFNGNSSILGEWVQLYYDKSFAATRIDIGGDINGKCPSAFTLVGSIDGTNWNLLSQQSEIKIYNTSNIFNINNYRNYNYYRTIFTNTNCSNAIGIKEIKYYGVQISTYINNDTFNNIIYNTNETQFPPITPAGVSFAFDLDDVTSSYAYNPSQGQELYGLSYNRQYINVVSYNINNEIYTIYNSSNYKLLYIFFTSTTNLLSFDENSYNSSTGIYSLSSCIKSDYTGEWVIIKLPNKIVLTRFIFYNAPINIIYSPAEWKCYGSNDGIIFTEIIEASNYNKLNANNYKNGSYEKKLSSTFNIPYLYIGWVINKIIGSATKLGLTRLLIFGKKNISNLWSISSSSNITYNFPLNIKFYKSEIGTSALFSRNRLMGSLINKYIRFNYADEFYINEIYPLFIYTGYGSNIINTLPNIYIHSFPILIYPISNNTNTNNNTYEPIIWYKFDKSDITIDYGSLNNGNLTNNNVSSDTTFGNYVRGNCGASFLESSSSYFTIPNKIDLNAINISNGITISFFIKLVSSSGAYSRIFDFGTPTTPATEYISIYRDGITNHLIFDINGTTLSTVNIVAIGKPGQVVSNYFDNQWKQITWVISNTGAWTIYINGLVTLSAVTNPTNVKIPSSTGKIYYIGKALDPQITTYNTMYLNDFRIYNSALIKTDVHLLYSGRYEIYSKSSVGIGTYTPNSNYILDVFGNTSINGRLSITNPINPIYISSLDPTSRNSINIKNDTTYNAYMGVGGSTFGGNYQNNFFIESSSSSIIFNTNGRTSTSTPNMIINTTGNVGIGTTNPGNILQVGDGGRLRIANNVANNSDYTIIGASDADGIGNPRIVINGTTRSGINGAIEYITVGSSTTTKHIFSNINSDGTSKELLVINQSGGLIITGGTTTYEFNTDDANRENTYLTLKGNSPVNDVWVNIRQIGTTSDAIKIAFDFLDNGNDARFCIRNIQVVNGGTDIITEVFTVDNGTIILNNTINSPTSPDIGVNGGTGDRIILKPGTASIYPYSIGLNTTTMWFSVPLSASYAWYANGNIIMNLTTNGQLTTIDDIIGFSSLSDKRLKTNIKDLSINCLELINNIKSVEFNWIDNERIPERKRNTLDHGFIAQDIEELLPNLVNNEGTYKSLKYEKFAPYFVKAIQELHKIIENQQKQIDLLMSKLNILNEQKNYI